ncbi:MAG TPA: hypothetical protein VGZ71_10140, partial [Puia sp.]|nr:hypothetical protein [Puia sp.]
MCKFIVIFVGLLSFHCLGADSENNFQRTNNETDSFEVLFKKYSSNNVSVKLIPMAHCASLGFFERVESELDGKIAIYELMGADLTAKKDIFELNAATRRMTETLGPLYLKAYQAAKILNDPFAAMAKKYDLKYQLEYLSYNKAKELIWADVEDPVFHHTIIELRRSLADIETFRQDNFIAPAKILITK